MAKKSKTQELNGEEMVSETAAPQGTPVAETPAKHGAGRPAFPRDENGKIIYPEGYQPKSRKANTPKTPANVQLVNGALVFGNGVTLTANGEWRYNTPANTVSEAETLIAAMSGLPAKSDTVSAFCVALREKYTLDTLDILAIGDFYRQ